jgi:hypothetical protein
MSCPFGLGLRRGLNGTTVAGKDFSISAKRCRREFCIFCVPLLRSLRISRGVSRCTLPLLLRLFPGVLAALARSLSALIACGVVGATRRAEIGRVAGPPLGVLTVPGVRKVGVLLLPGVGPALTARRNGVMGSERALAFGVATASCPGERRCFLRAESAMVVVAVAMRQQHAKWAWCNRRGRQGRRVCTRFLVVGLTAIVLAVFCYRLLHLFRSSRAAFTVGSGFSHQHSHHVRLRSRGGYSPD